MSQEDELNRHNQYQRQYYEQRSTADNHRMWPAREAIATPYIAHHLQRLVAFGQLAPADRILDVGCGMGKYTIPLAHAGYRVQGLDLSPVLLDTLQQHATGIAEIPVHCADILKPPAALHGGFDVVMGSFMLHHVPDLGKAFSGMAQLLDAGGRVVFIDVNPCCPLYYLQITLSPTMRWAAEKGLFALTRKNLRTQLEQAGFTDIHIARFGICPPAIRNLPLGRHIDESFDRLGWLNGMAAFQLVAARKS